MKKTEGEEEKEEPSTEQNLKLRVVLRVFIHPLGFYKMSVLCVVDGNEV